jgi:nucleotide-binding universal stress UspA family protein
MVSPEIVVAVDGSAASDRALRWAALEADRHNADLLVTHVYDGYRPGSRASGRAVVESAVRSALAIVPNLAVRECMVAGRAAAELVGATRGGAMIVLGNRGRGGFGSLLLGSVSQQVATHASGSVVVVRGHGEAANGPVVVGVDDSDAAGYALGVAFEEAAARGTGVVAVRAYPAVESAWGMQDVPPVVADPDEQLEVLDVDVAPWHDKYPEVEVETVAVEGPPARTLLGRAGEGQLVVVGTRGHGGFAGLLLGSVGQQLLHHADVPVLIARAFAPSRRRS